MAAGLSERMGRFKPLLPLGDCRVIERVVNFFRDAGVADILLVTGHRGAQVRQAVAPLDVRCVDNPDYQNGMFTSVLAGIRALPENCRAFFIHPVDIPLVRPATVKRLAAVLDTTPAAVIYPAFDARRGHPTLIRADLVAGILQWPGDGGLRAFLQRHEDRSMELAVADEAVLLDLDTPEDYSRMVARIDNEGLPSDSECRVLMDDLQRLPGAVAEHCRAVAAVARRIVQALAAAGVHINGDLVRTAALLHDIARSGSFHAEAGARLLEQHGFSRLAPLVAAHMDLETDENSPMNAEQIVYLADKLVAGGRQVDLEQRFARKMAKYGSDPQAVAAIARRRENALRVRAKVERITGVSIDVITGRSLCE